ncbi:MAG: hypothetical protein RID53_20970 [Coleofasciculus sp. B1-GNL1-01]|uniref:hypothetical protein n=1 Tax=Coleofasciculus sp. B1-GNL1-01 TaxID=3068484 RepID=UPI0032F1A4D1
MNSCLSSFSQNFPGYDFFTKVHLLMLKQFTPENIPDGFWEAIALARNDYEQFVELLQKMNRGTLIRFCWNYEEAAAYFKAEPYLNYVDPALSEDGIDDLCKSIVGKGKDYYIQVVKNPKLMPSDIDLSDPALRILSEAILEYNKRYDEPVPYRGDSFA